MEARKSGTPCFFVSIPTIKYYRIYVIYSKHTMDIRHVFHIYLCRQICSFWDPIPFPLID